MTTAAPRRDAARVSSRRKDLAAAGGVWATTGDGRTCVDAVTGAALSAQDCGPRSGEGAR